MDKQLADRKRKADVNIQKLVIVLAVVSLIGIAGRLVLFPQPHLSGGDNLWRLSIEVAIKTTDNPTMLQISPPFETGNLRVIQRSINHPGFRIRNWSEERGQRRTILAYATENGQRAMTTEFIIYHKKSLSTEHRTSNKKLTNQQRERYLRDSDTLQLQSPVLVDTLQRISIEQPAQRQLIDEIFDYLKVFGVSYEKDELHVSTTLEKKKATVLDRALAMVALCRAAGIPARVVTGLVLQEEIEPVPHYWVEAYHNENWLAFDIQAGYREYVPSNYLTLQRNNTDIVRVYNGELLALDFDLEREFDHPFLKQIKEQRLFNIFDLTRLSIDVRNELAILLLLPFGILITALFRHLVGLHSYGVFTPTLLALALIYTDIVTTLVIFLVICTIALAGRSLFPAKITRIPRLAIIFTLVAIIMSLSISVLEYFNLQQEGNIILLPIIILTSVIDRIYRTIEERGMKIAMRRLVLTIIITMLCLPVIQFESLGQFMVNYPELHFSTLALFLLISSYKGKQLINLPIIRLLAEPEAPKKKSKSATDN